MINKKIKCPLCENSTAEIYSVINAARIDCKDCGIYNIGTSIHDLPELTEEEKIKFKL